MLRKFIILMYFLFPLISYANCPSIDGNAPDISSLHVTNAGFSVAQEQFDRKVTSFGIIKNSSPYCFKGFLIEIKYFDAQNQVIDVVLEDSFSVVIPASGEIEFRAFNIASKPKEIYASQTFRLIHAEPYPVDLFARNKKDSSWHFEIFLPWLLFLLPVIFIIYAATSKNSPQQRQLVIKERQVIAHELTSFQLKRIADALENNKQNIEHP